MRYRKYIKKQLNAFGYCRNVMFFLTFTTSLSAQAQSTNDLPADEVKLFESQLIRDDFLNIEDQLARLEVEKAKLEFDLAKKASCPTINGFVNGGFRDDTFRFSVGSDIDISGHFISSNISLEQPIFDGFKTKHSIGKADANMRSTSASLNRIQQQSRLDLINALIAIKLAKGQLQLREDGFAALNAQLASLLAKKDRGLATTTEISNVASAKGLISASIETARRDLDIAILEWQSLGGRQDVETIPLPLMDSLPNSPDLILKEALLNNPLIIELKNLVEAANFETSIQKSNSYPNVNLIGQVSASESPVSFGDFSDQQEALSGIVGLNVEIPIYQSGQNSGARKIAHVEEQSAKLDLDLAVRDITLAVMSNWKAIEAYERLQDINTEAINASQKSANGYERGLNAGVSTIQEVVQANLDLIAAKERLLANRLNKEEHRYALNGLMGRIFEASTVNENATNEVSWFAPINCLKGR